MNTLNRLRAMTPEDLATWIRARMGAFTWAERQALETIDRERGKPECHALTLLYPIHLTQKNP